MIFLDLLRKYFAVYHGGMVRDAQRSKVYNAEMAVRAEMNRASRNAGVDLRKVPQIEAYIDKVKARKRVQAQYRNAKTRIRVGDGRGRRVACGGTGYVVLPLWARNEQVILHELTHGFVGTSQQHNWRFCEGMLFLVRQVMGVEAAEILKASYRKHKVAFTAPREKRTVSPERRAELAERLAANRPQFTRGQFMIKVPPEPGSRITTTYWVRRTGSYFGAEAQWEVNPERATIWTTREGVERFVAKHCTKGTVEIIDLTANTLRGVEDGVPS